MGGIEKSCLRATVNPSRRRFKRGGRVVACRAMRRLVSQHAIVRLMACQAITLAIASALHLSGADSAMDSSARTAAGLAEALICVALVFGAAALAGGRPWGQTAAMMAIGFAIFGFVLGLSFTVRGGDTPDVAYHATMLGVFIVTAIQLSRLRQPHRQA